MHFTISAEVAVRIRRTSLNGETARAPTRNPCFEPEMNEAVSANLLLMAQGHVEVCSHHPSASVAGISVIPNQAAFVELPCDPRERRYGRVGELRAGRYVEIVARQLS